MHFLAGLLFGSIGSVIGLAYLAYSFPVQSEKIVGFLAREVKK